MCSEPSLRRSRRLLGLPVSEVKPRKKARKAKTSQKRARPSPTSILTRQLTRQSPRLHKKTLLSLPDETLTLIFEYLRAFDSSGTFDHPRHAFALALASKRLLRIFSSNFTRITPLITNDSPPTLAYPHMFSVISLAGRNLRELNISRSSSRILYHLSDLCPRLEKLTIHDPADYYDSMRTGIFLKPVIQKLRSFSIIEPWAETLRRLVPPPEELHLIELNAECTEELELILNNPPKKLSIHINGLESEASPRLLTSLHQACPKMEEVSVKFLNGERDPIDYFLPRILHHLQKPRQNEQSLCRKMILDGEGDLIELLKHANPKAFVEVSLWGQTFVNDGSDQYAKSLPLIDEYLTEDFSTITETTIPEDFNPAWKYLISDMRFSRAWVEMPQNCNGLGLCADVVEIPVDNFSGTDWKWLRSVTEVWVMDEGLWVRVGETVSFLKSMAKLLKQFQGNRVWLELPPDIDLRRSSTPLKRQARKTLAALNEFEARGGDAGTVRAMINEFLR